jgi:hypothetical protein
MIRSIFAAAIVIVALAQSVAQNLTFTKIPLPSQLFQRNLATNQADINIIGTCPSYTQFYSLEMRLSNESGAVIQTLTAPLNYSGNSAAFTFSTKITAAKNNHVIEIYGQKTAGGAYFLEKRVEKLPFCRRCDGLYAFVAVKLRLGAAQFELSRAMGRAPRLPNCDGFEHSRRHF